MRPVVLSLATLLFAGAPRQVNPLSSPQRRMLLGLIQSRPGCSVTQLMAHVPFQWGSMSYHLDRLQEAGLIQIEVDPTDGRRKRIYPIVAGVPMDVPPPERDPELKGLCLAVALAVARNPGCDFSHVCEVVDTARRNIHYHLKRLHEQGLVTSGSTSRYRDLRPTPKLLVLLGEDGEGAPGATPRPPR